MSDDALPRVTFPFTCNVPPITVLPVAWATWKFAPPTCNVVPSKVKLASSSSSPPVPAITILLFVKSSILAEAISAEVATSKVATSKSPAISTSLGNPIVTVFPDADVSISLAVPAIVSVSSDDAPPENISMAIEPLSPATPKSKPSINSLTP